MIKIGQSAAKPIKRKVQRLSRKRVHSSEWKWGTSYSLAEEEDIVSSMKKFIAAKANKD